MRTWIISCEGGRGGNGVLCLSDVWGERERLILIFVIESNKKGEKCKRAT